MAKLIMLTTKQKIKDNTEKNRSSSKMEIKQKPLSNGNGFFAAL